MGHMISPVSDLTSGPLTLRCALHWPDPAQRDRIAEIRDNLTARIAEADREGWPGGAEGLKISRAGAEHELAQIDRRTRTPGPVGLGMPALSASSFLTQTSVHTPR